MASSTLLTSPFSAFHLLATALLGYWVHIDADRRGSNANLLWALGCVLVPPLVFGYLLYRSEIGGRTDPAGRTERAVGTFVVAHFSAVLLRSVLGYVGPFPPSVGDPIVESQYYALLFAAGAIPGYWLVWRRGWPRVRREFGWVHESERADR